MHSIVNAGFFVHMENSRVIKANVIFGLEEIPCHFPGIEEAMKTISKSGDPYKQYHREVEKK